MIKNLERQPIITNFMQNQEWPISPKWMNNDKAIWIERSGRCVPFWLMAEWSLERRPEEWSWELENVEKEVNEVGAEDEEDEQEEKSDGKAKE